MGRSQISTLPLIPLPRGTILLPGLIQRITVNSSRPDIPALLATVYERAASNGPDSRIDSIPIACVPLSSPLVGPDGQLLIRDVEEEVDTSKVEEINPGSAKRGDLFSFGVAAKIVGIDGRGSGEFALRVEGTSRITIESITKERPFFEAKVTYYNDDSTIEHLFHFDYAKKKHANIGTAQSARRTSSCRISLACSKYDQESWLQYCESPRCSLAPRAR